MLIDALLCDLLPSTVEVCPEKPVTAKFKHKKSINGKLDYGISINGKYIITIECKKKILDSKNAETQILLQLFALYQGSEKLVHGFLCDDTTWTYYQLEKKRWRRQTNLSVENVAKYLCNIVFANESDVETPETGMKQQMAPGTAERNNKVKRSLSFTKLDQLVEQEEAEIKRKKVVE
jgi:hypothetical protein